MYVYFWWQRGRSSMTLGQPAYKDGSPIGGTGRGNKLLPNTTDWLGRWRMAANPDNDWMIDREAQRNNAIYTGIDGIHLQDQAITESMGPIVDHAFEHLAPSDIMITRTRRRLLRRRARCARRAFCPRRRGRGGLPRRAQRLHHQRQPPGAWQELYAELLAEPEHPQPSRCARRSRSSRRCDAPLRVRLPAEPVAARTPAFGRPGRCRSGPRPGRSRRMRARTRRCR